MRDIIVRYYQGTPIQLPEVKVVLEEYMKLNNKVNPTLLDQMFNPMYPFGQSLVQKAIEVAAEYFATEYTITKLYSKEGHLLMVY
jgi:hypothetical protein